MSPSPIVEVCVDSVAGALAAERAGANRVELCANLLEGGTTPSPGAIALARRDLQIGLMVIVRPRGGDFLYTDVEEEVMRRDIEAAGAAGADGVVLGMLHDDGRIDLDRTRRLIECARPMQVTFHRAFDMSRDPRESLDQLIELGVDRVLTSGQRATVPEGLELLTELVQRAGGRISVMPGGGGVDHTNVAEIIAKTGASEIHFAARERLQSGMQFRNPDCGMGSGTPLSEFEHWETDEQSVRRSVEALR